jgi:hypothetical protein
MEPSDLGCRENVTRRAFAVFYVFTHSGVLAVASKNIYDKYTSLIINGGKRSIKKV